MTECASRRPWTTEGTDAPMHDSAPFVTFVSFTFVLAGLVKGMVGLGLPTVAIALLGLAMSPAKAASLLVIPSLLTNLWQSAIGPALGPLLRRLWPMLATIFIGVWVGTWAGAGIATQGDSGQATAALGVALALYAVLGLISIRVSVSTQSEWWMGPLVGLATGAVSAATGVFSIPSVLYLQAIGLQKDELVQALGLTFTVCTVALASVLAKEGVLRPTDAGVSLLVLVSAILGLMAGQRIRKLVRVETFRLCFYLGLLAIGIHLALRSIL